MVYNLQVDEKDIEVIGMGLDELKFRVAQPVALKLQAQINTQQEFMKTVEKANTEVVPGAE